LLSKPTSNRVEALSVFVGLHSAWNHLERRCSSEFDQSAPVVGEVNGAVALDHSQPTGGGRAVHAHHSVLR
jgi:hypothetical protein